LKYLRFFLLACALWFAFLQNLHAAVIFKKGTFIRDAEIEQTLYEFTKPLFKVAGLDPESISIYIIVNPEINAAASVNFSFFLNTGFLIKSESADQVIGVLAHETGHIADGHIARTEDAYRKSSLAALAALALGAAAALAGQGDASAAIMSGGMRMAEGNFLHYSQGQEASADQAALRFLDKLHWSSKGLLEFMQVLAGQELRSPENQDPYLRTHPLSSDRVDYIRNFVSQSRYSGSKLPASYQEKFKRMKMKLDAFLNPGQVLLKYAKRDNSLEARYALSIAYFMTNEVQKSLSILENLISEFPHDPYFHELKGQILFENGKIEEAIAAYRQAVNLKPDTPLIRISYAQALLETQTQSNHKKALEELLAASDKEKQNAFLWQLLAVCYGKEGQIGMSALCLAEKALTEDNFELAKEQAKRANHLLPGGPGKIRAKDILLVTERKLSNKEE
jgi:predicted Zn-dependent protease